MAIQSASAVAITGGTALLTDGTATQSAATLGQLQAGEPFYYTASGASTITATPSPALTAYAAGQTVRLKMAGVNPGAVTLNLNGLGAKNVLLHDASALAGGELVGIHEFTYDGTQFIVTDPAPRGPTSIVTGKHRPF